REAERTEHSVEALVKQRVMGLALGYEDLNDHDVLRHDPLLAALSNAPDPSGVTRKRPRDRGAALAGKSTLNRLELTPASADAGCRYKKIVADPEAMDRLLVELFLEAYVEAPASIIIDVDATDDPLHGEQEGRFFHGYYREYCYLPLYFFCGEQLLCARLRTADVDPAAGVIEELARMVGQIRARWPQTQIILRGDGGFCRDALMSWCEAQPHVDFIVGMAKNHRLTARITVEMAAARAAHARTGNAARVFKDFRYRTRDSWSCERRVIGKAEYLEGGENPRFIVTSLTAADARHLYEDVYCARGEMENRIKEQQLMLFADRTSTHAIASNQLRLYFSSFAYVLVQTLRRLGLQGTALAKAQCSTIRLKLLKLGAQIRISVRRIVLAFSEGYPYAALFRQVLARLRQIPIRA
ncbi:MAG: IS1380 family transposase, partial [Terriglobales bacterium]